MKDKGIIYSGKNCPPCKSLKTNLQSRGLEIPTLYIGEDLTLAEFRFKGLKKTPTLVRGEDKIEGFANIVKYTNKWEIQ